MKLKAFFFIFFIFSALVTYGNIGQPGIWKAGGGISLLLPNDSLVSRHIKMEGERIDLFVFSGFGIVNGHYLLTNTSDTSISFTMGYPINSIWRGEAKNNPFGYSFRIDSLAGFEVEVDGAKEKVNPEILKLSQIGSDAENWLIWKITFAPRQTRTINVTYISPTSKAKVTNLKGERKAHGLMYIFESGAIWKGNIEKAELFVHFMDGLTTEDVIGIRPCDQIQLLPEHNMLYFHKSNWEPEPGENLYLLYQSRKNKYYSFAEGVQDQNLLYSKIAKLSSEPSQVLEAIHFECQDILDIDSKSPYAVIVLGILGGSLLLFILLVYVIVKLIKKQKNGINIVE